MAKRKRRGYSQGDSYAKCRGRQLAKKKEMSEIKAEIATLKAEKTIFENLKARREQQIRDADFRWRYHNLRLQYLTGGENV